MSVLWYAIRVKSRFEKKTAQYLQANQYEVFAPSYRDKRQWSDRVKEVDLPLFSSYVFCRMEIDRRLPVLQAPGVVDIVSFGQTCEPVPDEQIEAIRVMVSAGVRVRPWPFLQVGQQVRLERGPLAGLEGILTEVRKEYRLVVSIPLLQRSIAAEVDRAWVTHILPVAGRQL